MIVDLNRTSTRTIAAQLGKMHEERGEAATDRVLTLLIVCTSAELEDALAAANAASRTHPCRVIAIVTDGSAYGGEAALNAQIRFGADAGAGEVIVLRPTGELIDHADSLVMPLLISDAPCVAWWPGEPPANPSADPIGRIAASRITNVMQARNPKIALAALQKNRTAGDVDLSWTRLTLWRARLASLLDLPPHELVESITVRGQKGNLSVLLLAAWLQNSLHAPATVEWTSTNADNTGIWPSSDGLVTCVELRRATSSIVLNRAETGARVRIGAESEQTVSIPRRSLADCISEELGQLNPDPIYARTLASGFDFSSIARCDAIC